MKPCLQLKRFQSPDSVGNRVRNRLIIKLALNPKTATWRIERQRDRATADQRDRQIVRERKRKTQRGRDEYRFAYTAVISLLNFSNKLFLKLN